LGWEEDVYSHLAFGGNRVMGQLMELAAKGSDCCGGFE